MSVGRRYALALVLAVVAILVLLLVVATDDTYGAGTSRATVRQTICQVFGQRCGPALQVALCETGGTLNPRAIGRAGERGILQLHPVHFYRVLRSRYGGLIYVEPSRLFEVYYNLRVGYVLSNGGRDWSPWACAP